VALITNNISGSASGNSVIGVTGSLIFGNVATLPGFPGSDVTFFVSGSRTGKADGQNVAVFGGDTVISGALTVGTGSVTIDSNEIRFLGGNAKIYSGSGGLTFQDSSGAKTLSSLAIGGSAANFFYDTAGAGKLYTTASSIAFRAGESLVDEAADKGADVIFYVSGSQDGTSSALFGGNVILSGSLSAKDSSGATTIMLGKSTGYISGSGDFDSGGNLTVDGTSTLRGAVTAVGSLTVGGTTTLNGDLVVNGTTTTVSSSNTTIADPVLLIGSGSVGPNATSVIAFSSGSASPDDVVFGTKNGILVAARYNTTGGNLPYTDIGVKALVDANLIGIKAQQFFVNGDFTAVSSSAGAIIVSGSATQGVALNHGVGRTVSFVNGTVQYLSAGVTGGDAVIRAPNNRLFVSSSADVVITGSNIDIRIGSTSLATNFMVDGSAYLSIISGSYSGPQNSNLGIVKSSPNRSLTLAVTDGVGIDTGRINFAQGGTSPGVYLFATSGSVGAINNVALLKSAEGASLVLSGANSLILGGGVGGGAAGYHALVGSNTNSLAIIRQGLFPAADRDVQQFDLGADNRRWANIYTGDLHLKNERGDYTIIEESDFLTVRFNKTGKRYKFVLEPVPDLDEK